MIKTINHCC